MAREKKTYLFHKNHIEIFKIENPEIPIWKSPVYEHVVMNTYIHTYLFHDNKTKDEKYRMVKKESPLGFYYIKKEKISKETKPFEGRISRTIVTFPVNKEANTYYQLKYVTEYDENKTGGEDGLRPWDIYPGDKGFPDNMLTALIKEVTTFFNNAEYIKEFSKNPDSYYYGGYYHGKLMPISVNDVKREVFKELFGNENGPRFQTNEEKILAHGFDLKTSFRKDKEKK